MGRLTLIMLLPVLVSSVIIGAAGGSDIVAVGGIVGGTVKLPCDTTPPSSINPLLLTVWFKDHIQDPIYR